MRFLENQIAIRRRKGVAASVVGVAMGIGALSPTAAQAQNTTAQDTVKQETKAESTPVDLSFGATDTVRVRGTVILKEDNEPVYGVSVRLVNTPQQVTDYVGVVTDMDGCFDVIVASDAVLRFSYVGSNDRQLQAREVLENNGVVVLDSDGVILEGEVVIVRTYYDDVYGHFTPKWMLEEKKAKTKESKNK